MKIKKVYETSFYVAGEKKSPLYVTVFADTPAEAMENGQKYMMDAFPKKFSSDFIPCGCTYLGITDVDKEKADEARSNP